MPAEARPGKPSDLPALVSTVVSAFADDPAWSFIIGSDDPACRAAFAQALLAPRLIDGTAWVTDDCSSVSTWQTRGGTHGNHDQVSDEWLMFRRIAGEAAWDRLLRYEEAMSASTPAYPYRYLELLATRPECQGVGLAPAVLEAGLRTAHAQSLECWLDTSSERNLDFYAARGFTFCERFTVTATDKFWLLARPAVIQA